MLRIGESAQKNEKNLLQNNFIFFNYSNFKWRNHFKPRKQWYLFHNCRNTKFQLNNFFKPFKVIVYPNIADENGIFQTNNINDYYKFIKNGKIFYQINFPNLQKLLIEIELNENFLRKGLVVERTRSKLFQANNLNYRNYLCHFQGKIKDVQNSYVAISVCNSGLVFYF